MCMIGKPLQVIPSSKNHYVIAYRVFGVKPDLQNPGHYRLHGSVYSFDYKRVSVNNTRPKLLGKTGFWAFKSLKDVHRKFREDPVVAKVKLSGHMIEHELGYRAMKMEILELRSRRREVPVVEPSVQSKLYCRYGIRVK